MFVFVLIILIFLLSFSAVVGEYYRIHSIQTNLEYGIQLAVNVSVEEAMRDSFRQDKIGRLDTARAMQNLTDYLRHEVGLTPLLEKYVDGALVYSVQLTSVTGTEDPPRLFVKGKIFIATAYPFLITNIEVPFSIASRNTRID